MVFGLRKRASLVWAAMGLMAATAWARVGLVVGEPFGAFGTMMPVGHASVLLTDWCAGSPTEVRSCLPGEPRGVVVSRYHDLRRPALDWLAFPAAVFFYGVDEARQAPGSMTARDEHELRQQYWQAHLRDVVPATTTPKFGDWAEGIGAAFDRRLLVYSVDATADQEAALVDRLNAAPNQRRYTLGRSNCADFAADLLRMVLPEGTLRRQGLVDFEMTTPKTLAKEMDAFGAAHPERELSVIAVPQIAGTLRRSRPLRGAAETFVKQKRYVLALVVLQPEALAADWAVYEARGKWTPGRDATAETPGTWWIDANSGGGGESTAISSMR